MRRHSTVIAIVIAALLAAVIVIASSALQELRSDSARPAADTSAPPPERPDTGMSPQSGMVDTAAAAESVAILERAHEANPDSVRVALNLGDAYFAAGRYDDATTAYRKALAINPGHPSATVRLAMVWHVRGEDARAVRAIVRVIDSLPDYQEAHYDLALIRFSSQEIAAARESWVRAAEIDPTSRLGQASQDFVDLLSDGEGQAPDS